ncbi:terminase small subunit [Burkholderia cenocepacia]|uniref:terminase small subunit n=1 Tax=Burkholderia cenocepacia TaxID=95486 RepID=UPI00097BDC7E|nr:terminase small subunit [Burkholderia cenocepacia]AQQ46743.1 terminase small subunit [Burkholderia cenocepacia]MBR8265074.1 terminase small subunit [Burkholderia cenocepacia]ONJ01603.1 terminase small subunit [Burkholderia cenocepacia]ONY85475.1 terminase small subunit [Burkholderia cenocepacia]ONZ10380.1 terminase small subunit [Burkholderia cenocepacia]
MTLMNKKDYPEPERGRQGAIYPKSEPTPDHAQTRIVSEPIPELENPADQKLTFQEEILCLEYSKDANWLRACRRAGVKSNTTLRMAPHIRRRLDELAELRNKKHAAEADTIIEYLYNVVKADPNELAEVQQGACRYCYGYDVAHKKKTGETRINHKYQFRTNEERRIEKDANGGELPNGNGGIGYSKERAPHPECPMCDGRGETNYIVHDTNTFTPARALIKGIKIAGGQVEIALHDKLKAADMLLKVMGKYEQDNKQKNGNKVVIEGGITRAIAEKLGATPVSDQEASLQADLESFAKE